VLTETAWAELENRFTHHPPLPGQAERYAAVRDQAFELARLITAQCPPSRETSLALTSLEQAVFWANAAITRNEARFEKTMAEMAELSEKLGFSREEGS
jgi:uncharacterized sporulation protein YeaH/YhbH (DUF444 family)